MFRVTFLIALVFATLFAAPIKAQIASCAFAEPAMCHPSLPGLEDQLAPELSVIEIDSFAMAYRNGRWVIDITLSTTDHPGEVRVAAWRDGFTYSETWVAGSERSFTIPAGGARAGTHGLTIEWESNSRIWHRWVGLHYSGAGTYHFTAGEGSLIPWWLE